MDINMDNMITSDTNTSGCWTTVSYAPPAVFSKINSISDFNTNLIDCSVNPPLVCHKQEENKKEKNMCYDCEDMVQLSPEERQRQYLRERAYAVEHDKRCNLRKKFGLADDDSPTTPKEFFERILAGKYFYPQDQMEKRTYPDNVTYRIRWRDPALKEDPAGFAEAEKPYDAAYTVLLDTIAIGTPAEGLAALKEFEAKSF